MPARTRRELAGILVVFGFVAVEIGIAYPGLFPHMTGTAVALGAGAVVVARGRMPALPSPRRA